MNLNLPQELGGLPHIEEYFGVWSMFEPKFNALLSHAERINIQLHVEKLSTEKLDENQAARQSDYDESYVSTDDKTVAVINLHGTLLKQVGSLSANTSTVVARRKIRRGVYDDNVAAILLHVDSPGGVIAGVADLADDVLWARSKKPVFAYVEDLGASAAYWVASQAQSVFMNRTGLVGSIGVFSVVYDASIAAAQQGVKVHVIRAGEFKGAGVLGTEVTQEQLGEWQKTVTAAYDDFKSAVAIGRNISGNAVDSVANGRIFRGQEAVDLLLIDGLQSLDATVAQLFAAAAKSSTNRRAETMSDDTNKVEGAAPEQTPAKVETPATIEQMKAVLTGASADFILEQLERKATMPQAMEAYISLQNERLDASMKKEAELAAADSQRTRASGPIAPNEPTKPNETGASGFLAIVEKERAKGLTWRQACAKAAKQDPTGHKAFLLANQKECRPETNLTMVEA